MCQDQCIHQDITCVKACKENLEIDDQNACLASCNDNWWDCTCTCKRESLDNSENLNDWVSTSLSELKMTRNVRLPLTSP
jgi:hypothetical protein